MTSHSSTKRNESKSLLRIRFHSHSFARSRRDAFPFSFATFATFKSPNPTSDAIAAIPRRRRRRHHPRPTTPVDERGKILRRLSKRARVHRSIARVDVLVTASGCFGIANARAQRSRVALCRLARSRLARANEGSRRPSSRFAIPTSRLRRVRARARARATTTTTRRRRDARRQSSFAFVAYTTPRERFARSARARS